MQLQMVSADAAPSLPRLTLSIATTPEEVREVQQLRYKVFVEAGGLPELVNDDEVDRDDFDNYCAHLIVRDTATLQVVGTYRVLGPEGARRIGRFYSEQEFDLSRLINMRGRMAEAGRACIHPDYRSGAVILLLWTGLAAFMKKEKCDYLIGCASIPLDDGGRNAATLYHALSSSHLAPSEYRVTPLSPLNIHEHTVDSNPRIPPLIKGYLRGGAWICGEPAWDPDFRCADLFLLLPLAKLDNRYARHYLKEKEAA